MPSLSPRAVPSRQPSGYGRSTGTRRRTRGGPRRHGRDRWPDHRHRSPRVGASAGRPSILIALLLGAALVAWDLAGSGTDGVIAHADPAVIGDTAGIGGVVGVEELAGIGDPATTSSPAALAAPTSVRPPLSPAVTVSGPGTFTVATGQSRASGHAGPLRRYRVAVEDGMGIAVDDVAAEIDRILADPRSWIGGGDVRVQRVDARVPSDFTIFLVTPATSERMCREDGLLTEQYTNCRLASGKVVLNLARWLTATPDYGAPVAVYRAYAVNHEVGHQLGHGHEACPGQGSPAPVMQQQTYGLAGCVANAWPYLDGVRYRGPAVA